MTIKRTKGDKKTLQSETRGIGVGNFINRNWVTGENKPKMADKEVMVK